MALDFDGNDDYVSLGTGHEYATASGSISIWFKPDLTYDGSQATLNILSMYSKGFYIYNGGGGVIRAYGFEGYTGSWLDTTTAVWTAGVWYNVVETWDSGSSLGKIYVNGIYENQVAYDGSFASTAGGQDIKFGRHYSIAARIFNGKIGDVAFFDRALSLGEIKNLYYRRLLPYSNVKGLWRMDEGKLNLAPGGLDCADISGNGVHGTAEATMTDADYVDGPPIQWNQGE